jgi:hypothetical protein
MPHAHATMYGKRRTMSCILVTEATFQLLISLLKSEAPRNCDPTQQERRCHLRWHDQRLVVIPSIRSKAAEQRTRPRMASGTPCLACW